MKPSVGVWIDDPLRKVLTPSYWDTVADHGISVAALMIEDIGNGLDLIYKEDTLSSIRTLAFARDVELVLTTWPEPNPAYLDEYISTIPGLLRASGATGLEFDTEGNWKPERVRGYKNLDVAGDRLVSAVSYMTSCLDVRIELTTYPYHVENSRAADIAPHVHRLLPQAYSVRKRTTGSIPWSSKYGPGSMQRLTLDRSKQIQGPKLSCGLAAYGQSWPGHKPEKAMQVAWDAALEYGVEEIRFWSSKWIFGVRANGYASRFLKSLRS